MAFGRVRVADECVVIPSFGSVKFYRYRPIGGRILEAAVGRQAGGKWYVAFVCDIGEAPAKNPVGTSVGVDLGLSSFVTLSDGNEVANPRFFRVGEARLAHRQRTHSRRRYGSASRERARVLVAKAHAHVVNQRKDFAYKLSKQLLEKYDLIVHEDLEIRGLSRGHCAKSVHDAAWGTFLRCLASKAESAGKHVIAVDPRGTTQRCSGCSTTVKKALAERTHACPGCGLVLGRDHNAALNVLALGRSVVEAGQPADEAEGST